MKHLILITLLCLPFTTVNAVWPFTSAPDPLVEAKEKIIALENHIQTQSNTLNRWQIATGFLAVCSVILLIIGTALGAKTRQHHYESTRRLGRTPPPTTPLNGRKSSLLDEKAEENTHQTLAA